MGRATHSAARPFSPLARSRRSTLAGAVLYPPALLLRQPRQLTMPLVDLLVEIHRIERGRRDNTGVPQNFLNLFEIRAALDCLARPGMAHRMRVISSAHHGFPRPALAGTRAPHC